MNNQQPQNMEQFLQNNPQQQQPYVQNNQLPQQEQFPQQINQNNMQFQNQQQNNMNMQHQQNIPQQVQYQQQGAPYPPQQQNQQGPILNRNQQLNSAQNQTNNHYVPPLLGNSLLQRRNNQYPRDKLQENEENLDLGGCYQKCLFCCGQFLGCLRTWIPCCCCVDYPYITVDQSMAGVYERFGKYVKTVQSGLQYVNQCTDDITIVDCKTQTIDISNAWSVSKDNILVKVDATVYYQITQPREAVYSLENIQQAVIELTYATLRTLVGQMILQDLLEKKQQLAYEVQKFVQEHIAEWGLSISQILFKDISMSNDIQETLASAARERRIAESKVINAKAEVESAKLMREAADILDSKSAMQIRYLDTLKLLGENSKVVFLGDEDKKVNK